MSIIVLLYANFSVENKFSVVQNILKRDRLKITSIHSSTKNDDK